MNKIEIFFDTSSIRPSLKNYVDFRLNTIFQDFIDFIGSKDLNENISINICQIVVMEIEKQIKDEYKKNIETLKCFPSITVENYKAESEYIDNLNTNISNYMVENQINVVDIPISSESYMNIINRAVNKKKPFVGGDKGDSDKGFKDAIQWETILEYSKNVKSTYFVLVTGNKCDFAQILEREFSDITKKNIRIFTSVGDAQDYILKINNMPSKYNYVKYLIDEMFTNNTILSFIEDKCEERKYEIDYVDSVENIVDLGNNFYEFNLYIDTEHQVFYKVECQLINETDLLNTDIIICL